MAIHSVSDKHTQPTSYDVGSMINNMREKFNEGLILINQLEVYTRKGDEKMVSVLVDLLGLDFDVYVKSAKEQGLWGTDKKEEK